MQQVWRKRWRATGWIALGAITLVLIVSAVTRKNQKVCNGIEVSFSKEGSNFFLDEKGVVSIIKSFGSIKGEAIENVNLKLLEERLKNDKWIAGAELFFDNKQVLHVIVEEKEPVARVFTVSGNSFYIDSACGRLPLSEKLSARIPMFTSFPSDRQKLARPDSQLLAAVKDLALFIQADDFWKAQVAQVDITLNGFEMIPTVGSHIVALGKDGEWQQKFDRLFSFYKQVWTQVGFEKYEKLDVQFNGQVVATVKGAKPARVDSVKARMAYENLLAEVKEAEATTTVSNAGLRDTGGINIANESSVKAQVSNAAAAKLLPSQATILKGAAARVVAKSVPPKQSIMKQAPKPAPKQLASNKKADEKKQPKAVMKKPVNNKTEQKKK
jgi:cell division protein FtsQ